MRSVVQALAATLQARDGYTGEHADAVHDLSVAVGARLGLAAPTRWPSSPPSRCSTTSARSASPDQLLHKPGPLTPEEWKVMRQHPHDRRADPRERSRGSRASPAPFATSTSAGTGTATPTASAGEAIPLASRIVLACDAWHALHSDRPYRKALPREQATRRAAAAAPAPQFDPTRRRRAPLYVLARAELGESVNPAPGPGRPSSRGRRRRPAPASSASSSR